MTPFRYPRDLLQSLQGTWHEWRRQELEAPALPDDPFLLNILETLYHASFTSDELRRTRLTAVVCAQEEAEAPLVFTVPRPFSVHELTRLAPVAADRNVRIGLSHSRHGDVPLIWGLCSDAFMQLTVSIVGPGTLEVGRNNLPLVVLRGGRIEDNSEGGAFSIISEFLKSANEELWKDIRFGGGSWSPELIVYPRHVIGLASELARLGHGGAILMIPDRDAEQFLARDWVHVKYRTNDNSLWRNLSLALRRYDDATHIDGEAMRHVQEAEAHLESLLVRVARLGAVDGAILLTDRLRVLGFGAEVRMQAAVQSVKRSGGGLSSVEDFGTRHRSAFRFCLAYPAGVAIVCSQDGGVRVARTVGEQVELMEF